MPAGPPVAPPPESFLRRLDCEAITYAVHLGGKLGLVFFAPPSLLIVLFTLGGEAAVFGLADEAALARWVRMGLELFLMGGWSFGSIEVARQSVARVLGAAAGLAMGGATGTLVMHSMAVTFLMISPDAPSLGMVAIAGTAVAFAAAWWMTTRRPAKPARGNRR